MTGAACYFRAVFWLYLTDHFISRATMRRSARAWFHMFEWGLYLYFLMFFIRTEIYLLNLILTVTTVRVIIWLCWSFYMILGRKSGSRVWRRGLTWHWGRKSLTGSIGRQDSDTGVGTPSLARHTLGSGLRCLERTGRARCSKKINDEVPRKSEWGLKSINEK